MGAPISVRKRTMVIKKEVTRGTFQTFSGWADADFDIEFFNITVSPEIAEYQRVYSLGDHDSLASVFGKRSCPFSASVDLRGAGANGTAPNLAKVMDMCGLRQTTNAGTSVTWNPQKSADLGGGVSGSEDLPFDVVIQDEVMGSSPSMVATKISGAMANGKIVMDEGGQPLRLDIEGMGVLNSIADEVNANILVPTGLDTTLPDTVKSATITEGGVVQRIDTMELDFGNTIELENDPSVVAGLLAAYVAERNPVCNYNPLADLVATDDVWSNWTGSTELVLSVATTHFTLAAQKAQIITLGDETQQGAKAWAKSLKLNRDSSNGYPWILTLAGY